MNRRERLLKCLNAPQGINRVYLGGMATARICRILGVGYPPKIPLADVIKAASDKAIDAVYAEMGESIEKVWRHGIRECQPIAAERIWVREGECRTTPQPEDEGFREYVRVDKGNKDG